MAPAKGFYGVFFLPLVLAALLVTCDFATAKPHYDYEVEEERMAKEEDGGTEPSAYTTTEATTTSRADEEENQTTPGPEADGQTNYFFHTNSQFHQYAFDSSRTVPRYNEEVEVTETTTEEDPQAKQIAEKDFTSVVQPPMVSN